MKPTHQVTQVCNDQDLVVVQLQLAEQIQTIQIVDDRYALEAEGKRLDLTEAHRLQLVSNCVWVRTHNLHHRLTQNFIELMQYNPMKYPFASSSFGICTSNLN